MTKKAITTVLKANGGILKRCKAEYIAALQEQLNNVENKHYSHITKTRTRDVVITLLWTLGYDWPEAARIYDMELLPITINNRTKKEQYHDYPEEESNT